MAHIFQVRPVRPNDKERERAFNEQLIALRLALGGLEAACADDPSRYRRAAAALERISSEIEVLSMPRGDDSF